MRDLSFESGRYVCVCVRTCTRVCVFTQLGRGIAGQQAGSQGSVRKNSYDAGIMLPFI